MFHRTTALPIAEKLVKLLSPHCEVINIAGSLLREISEVKDIELVLVAKRQPIGGVDLFGEGKREMRITNGFLTTVAGLGNVIKGQPSGRYMQIEIPVSSSQKINLDMFMPDPVDYWRQFVIRVGSAAYVKNNISHGWRHIGWCGSDVGLRKVEDCVGKLDPKTEKTSWTCVNPKAELPPAWSSEKEFYDFINVQWIHPKFRNL